MTRFGPVRYPDGPSTSGPRLITSFTEFESVYGGLEVLHAPTEGDERLSYVAHAARAFFMNGGTRLYISRVFSPRGCRSELRLRRGDAADRGERHDGDLDRALARRDGQRVGQTSRWCAARTSAYQAANFGGIVQVNGAKHGSIVEVIIAAARRPRATIL